MHLAPTASKRIYQQRVGRVTRRQQGKEAGIVVDFVHPATTHDEAVVTLHSLLDRDVYRGGAIVVGPVRRGRGRRVRVERRVLPVTPDPDRRAEVFERELWRIAVDHLDYGEQHVWAALAGARVAPNGWRRAKAMLHFDRQGDLKRRFLITAVERNRNAQLRLRALQEIAAARDAEAFDQAIDLMATWPRDERREGVKIMLQALAEKRIGRRDQANAWIWRMAEYTREVHEEYAVQRWPETKRLLGLLVNSSGGAHARNARRLVHASRRQDRRLSAALLAAALAHTPEAEEALRGARTRMARKPSALARELLRNFPRGRRSRGARRRRKGAKEGVAPEEALAAASAATDAALESGAGLDAGPDTEVIDEALGAGEGEAQVVGAGAGSSDNDAGPATSRRSRRRRGSRGGRGTAAPQPDANGTAPAEAGAVEPRAAEEQEADRARAGEPRGAEAEPGIAAPSANGREPSAPELVPLSAGEPVVAAAQPARARRRAAARRAARARARTGARARARARRAPAPDSAGGDQLELVPAIVEEMTRPRGGRRTSSALLDAVSAAAEAVRAVAGENGTTPIAETASRAARARARRASATRRAAASRAAAEPRARRAPRARAAARARTSARARAAARARTSTRARAGARARAARARAVGARAVADSAAVRRAARARAAASARAARRAAARARRRAARRSA
jgi:hypothetical protein